MATDTDKSAIERVQTARHPDRPYSTDLFATIFEDFVELHGDRRYADDPALVAGFAKLDAFEVLVVGQQKGRDTNQRRYRNFGMPKPEGYRKALRVMKLAEKFHVPVITFTGSRETGVEVMRNAAENLKHVHLELGGKNAIIVLDDADLDLAVEGIVWSAFGTSGQRCTAASRVIAHEAVYDALVARLVAGVADTVVVNNQRPVQLPIRVLDAAGVPLQSEPKVTVVSTGTTPNRWGSQPARYPKSGPMINLL